MVQYYTFMMHKVKFLYRTDYLIARLQLFKFKCINLFFYSILLQYTTQPLYLLIQTVYIKLVTVAPIFQTGVLHNGFKQFGLNVPVLIVVTEIKKICNLTLTETKQPFSHSHHCYKCYSSGARILNTPRWTNCFFKLPYNFSVIIPRWTDNLKKSHPD